MQRSESGRTGLATTHHGLTVGPTIACGGRRTAVRPARTAVQGSAAAGFFVFWATFCFLSIFALFCICNADESGPNSYLIHPIPISIFILRLE